MLNGNQVKALSSPLKSTCGSYSKACL